MILRFCDVGIQASDYNGFSAETARSMLINDACNYLKDRWFGDAADRVPDHDVWESNPGNWSVNWTNHTINTTG